MKRSEQQESPHRKLKASPGGDLEKTPRSSDKKVKENSSPHCAAIALEVQIEPSCHKEATKTKPPFRALGAMSASQLKQMQMNAASQIPFTLQSVSVTANDNQTGPRARPPLVPNQFRKPFGSNSKVLNQGGFNPVYAGSPQPHMPQFTQAMNQTPVMNHQSPQSSFDLNTFQHDSIPLRGSIFGGNQSPQLIPSQHSMTPIIKYQSPQNTQFDTKPQQISLKNQSLTPNPKQMKPKSQVELDFKSLQNYVLSNIDSSDKDQNSSDGISQLNSDNEEDNGVGSGLQNTKPWTLPVAETPFKTKNQIFYSPKVGPTSASKEMPILETSAKQLNFNGTKLPVTFTPVPKSNMQQILPRQDLNLDSPQSKFKYKNFLRDLKDLEQEPFINQLKHSLKQLPLLPTKIHWRVLLDLADLAKRESQIVYACRLFRSATLLQPYAYQGWLEWAKLCEESGEINQCKELLKEGLSYCIENENLIVKCIKVYEKDAEYAKVRKLFIGCDQWRVQVEGAQFEGRIGETAKARSLFSKLCQSFGNGPVYLEASRYEEREGAIGESLDYCEEGLDLNPRYAPLWFQYLRLYEKSDSAMQAERFDDLQTILNDLHQNVNQELEWKIYIEAAQMFERTGQLKKAVGFVTNSVLSCPENIKWKIWLLASRLLMRMGETNQSREVIERSCFETPVKQMPFSLIEYAKHFEMRQEISRAREIMDQAKRLSKGEWKTQFEAVMLEVRAGSFQQAEEMVSESLEVYFATGRLWATLIQMRHAKCKTAADFDQAFKTFKQALNEIPKSGEVWCEGARIAMANHPDNFHYSLVEAEKYLQFAIQFTPQYGDSFLELLRLYLLQKNPAKIVEIKQLCKHLEPNYGVLWFFFRNSVVENAIDVWDRAQEAIDKEMKAPAVEHYWIGSQQLIALLRKGMKGASLDLKAKVIYGFECVLPQVAFI